MISLITIEAYSDSIRVVGHFRPEDSSVRGYSDFESHSSESVTDLGQGIYQKGLAAGNIHPFHFPCLVGQSFNAFFYVDGGFDIENAASWASKIAIVCDREENMVHIQNEDNKR
jgi:hypothetical protein